MADTAIKNKNGNVKWIIALCLTITLAIVGWTTTANLSMRLKAMDEVRQSITEVEKKSTEIIAIQQANIVRISILENRYDTIQATLVEIKVMLQKLRDRE